MSRFIISFLLFVLINIMAAQALSGFLKMSPQPQIQEHTWTQWALTDFAKQKDNPSPVVFLGSSLMLMPINRADANFLNCTIDGAVHHKSALFDHCINGNQKRQISNFNFSLPGLMPSDAYLITRLLLSSSKHPQLIVYGLGPRDFLDNLLLSPASTDPFHVLSPSLPKSLLPAFIGQNWQLQLTYFFKQYLSLFEQKEKLSDDLLQTASSHTSLPAAQMSLQQLHTLLPTYNPMSIRVNECIFRPDQTLNPSRFTENLNEYRQRYHQLNWNTFTCQTKFFIDFLKLASNNDTKVLIAAMPITSINQQLLPDYIYAIYKENLRVLSKSYGANFIDLDDSGCFSDQDFLDTIHLNATGGARLIELISKYINQHKLIDQSTANHSRLAETGIKI